MRTLLNLSVGWCAMSATLYGISRGMPFGAIDVAAAIIMVLLYIKYATHERSF